MEELTGLYAASAETHFIVRFGNSYNFLRVSSLLDDKQKKYSEQ